MPAPPDDLVLDTEALLRLAGEHLANTGCPRCAALRCPGWEAFPAIADEASLRRIGSLRSPGDHDPTLDEYHPQGTDYWSAQAPIAPAFYPYNRCELWACRGCGRPFLRYTEYGGYYEEKRIRELRMELIAPA
ncbi:hypothetical protein [Variovorax guangxiensis]|uniref:hypothetical protein n=1 Tax=Variovorax guangxiensis TaxID=1775474 RepID=UPI0028652EF7|nr:hypothetical protein [Variovorax guangxiensis]MDR6855624.1 hypothetical protein [Variovorax guangxiensis]